MDKAWSLDLHPHIAAELVWTAGEVGTSLEFLLHQFIMDSDGSLRTVVLEFGRETPARADTESQQLPGGEG